MSYYIYRHIRPDKNEVFYIGLGKSRTKRAWETRSRTNLWNRIVNKNQGKFQVQILMMDVDFITAAEKEKEFIALYGRKSDNTGTLVNFQVGGENHSGWKMPEEKKERLRIRWLGNKINLGRVWTKEQKDKISVARKGKIGPNKGRIWNQEVREKMSLGHVGNLSHSGKTWINNGENSTLIFKSTPVPEGWETGRIRWKNNK